MSKILNKELLYRIISALVFIPIVVLPLIFSYYVSVFVYLIFLSVILNEIFDMNKRANKKIFLNIYSILTSFSFFIFLIFLITEKLPWYYLLLIILTIWLFDTFSYIGGKIIGGRKLMPKISSGKTISGLITGFISTLLIIEIFLFRLLEFDSLSLLLVFIIIISSFLGDTIVSILKRFISVKDSGRIMPGHGGLLDRFDSFIMVFFVIGIFYLII